jgi:hypothetical protein
MATTRIRIKRGIASAWSSANPVLGAGELGYDTTNRVLKVGDGVTAWNSLPGIDFDGASFDAEDIGFDDSGLTVVEGADVQEALASIDAELAAASSSYAPAAGYNDDPTLTSLGSVGAGNSTTFPLVVGDYLFVTVASDNKVKAFSLADRDNPVEIDELTVSSGPSHLAARGKYLFCWCQGAGAMVSIDISDPTTMSIAQTLTTRVGQRFVLNGRYACVGGPESSTGANTLSIIDTGNPASMAEIGTLVVGNVHRNIAALGPRHVAVASRDDNTLYIVDISDPRRPVQVGSLASLTQTLTALAVDPDFDRGRPYLYALGYGNGKFYVIDCADPTSPRKAGEATTTINAEWVQIEGRYAYVAIRGTGSIDVVDIANPALPRLVANTDLAATRLDRLAVANGRIYACETVSSGKVWTVSIAGGKKRSPAPLATSGNQLDRTGILAMRSYTPSSDFSTTSATFAVVDGTNLYWTFTAPASGKVRLGVEAIWLGNASAWQYVALADASDVEVSNTQRGVGVDSGRQRREVSWILTGLTPGASYTYKLMHASGTGGTSVSLASNNTSGRGDIIFRVDAIPA